MQTFAFYFFRSSLRKNCRKHLTPHTPAARIVLSCVFAVSIFSCKITTSEPDKFTVAFDANGGKGTIESITKTENEEFELPANTFTKTGFIFAGWYFTQDFSGEAITGWNIGEKTGDITLYAKWTVKSENVVNAIKNLTEGTHTVCVVG